MTRPDLTNRPCKYHIICAKTLINKTIELNWIDLAKLQTLRFVIPFYVRILACCICCWDADIHSVVCFRFSSVSHGWDNSGLHLKSGFAKVQVHVYPLSDPHHQSSLSGFVCNWSHPCFYLFSFFLIFASFFCGSIDTLNSFTCSIDCRSHLTVFSWSGFKISSRWVYHWCSVKIS